MEFQHCVPWMLFHRETSGGVAKFCLLLHASFSLKFFSMKALAYIISAHAAASIAVNNLLSSLSCRYWDKTLITLALFFQIPGSGKMPRVTGQYIQSLLSIC